MKKINPFAATLFLISSLLIQNKANAFTVTAYSPTDFSDELAGISGFTIEDFEDTTLIPGLSVEWSGPQTGPFTTLPRIINNSDYWFTPNNAWDGENMLGNFNPSGGYADITTLNFANNATSVGIGISNYQYNGATLQINGNIYGGLSDFNPVIRGLGKNVYLKIDAQEGEVINSIGIDGLSGDFIGFDHVAVNSSDNITPVPEPSSTATIIMLGSFGAIATFNRKRKQQNNKFKSNNL
ncbi:MAG: hypothetical protein F6K40_01120 [Okeania sp. SIO3I5]|uniref:hypothetical protein n=1 Tax=Okeania sp. SIO3I5 TaxID=2607805 RepID=UPI0013BD0EF1|nr:hypothetical protein [Okeania sp. SIO3I5]NEQ34984.1 hypothetical protein [Okeania sp. SIO3I5]